MVKKTIGNNPLDTYLNSPKPIQHKVGIESNETAKSAVDDEHVKVTASSNDDKRAEIAASSNDDKRVESTPSPLNDGQAKEALSSQVDEHVKAALSAHGDERGGTTQSSDKEIITSTDNNVADVKPNELVASSQQGSSAIVDKQVDKLANVRRESRIVEQITNSQSIGLSSAAKQVEEVIASKSNAGEQSNSMQMTTSQEQAVNRQPDENPQSDQKKSGSTSSKERITLHISADVIERIKNAVYWEPGLTIACLSEYALSQAIEELEAERGGLFPQRKEHKLKGGRPMS